MRAAGAAWHAVSGVLGRRSVASTAVVSLLSTVIVIAAVQSDGTEATNLRLNDGSVWVTNGERHVVGRLNIGIDELDFSIRASDHPEVLQDGRSVLFAGSGDKGVQSLNVLTGQAHGSNEILIEQYQIGGNVGAVLDPSSGNLWVGIADSIVAPDYPDKPDGRVAPGSKLVVTTAQPVTTPAPDAAGAPPPRGRVLVVDDRGWYEVQLGDDYEPLRPVPERPAAGGGDGSTSTSSTTTSTTVAAAPGVTLPPPEPEPLAEPTAIASLDVAVSQIATVSAVGSRPVFLLQDGTVVLSDTLRADIPGDGERLQQVGDDADSVIVASDTGLFAVDLESAQVEQLAAASGPPAAPVRVGGTVYGAWSGAEPTWFRLSGADRLGPKPIGAVRDADLVWRVNGTNVALNSTGNGDVWADHDGTLAYVGNWDDVEPQSEDSDEINETEGPSLEIVEKRCIEGSAEAPTAGDDELGARPRQSVIDVLNNDDDVNCEPIAITGVEPAAGEWGSLTIIDNGQHLLYSPSEAYLTGARTQTLGFEFTYVVSDPANNTSPPAKVSVVVRDRALGNLAPGLRPKSEGTREMRAAVESGRKISYDVTPDWWDADGDDLRLVGAAATIGGEVSSTPEGVVTFNAAGLNPGIYDIDVTMSDGVDQTLETMEVTVKPTGTAIKPVTTNDFTTLSVGSTTMIAPLDNDSDGNGTDLSLLPQWPIDPGFTANVRADDVVEVTANAAGVYALRYEASDGTDRAPAVIRLEILADDGVNDAPVAVPDKVKLRPYRVVNVDVLGNDIDPDGDLLGVVSVDVPGTDGALGRVRATVVDRRMVQVEVVAGPNGETPVGPFDVFYEITDGGDRARVDAGATDEQQAADRNRRRGVVTVLVQPPGVDQPPVAVADEATVRSGDIVAIPVLRNDIDPDSDEISLTGVQDEQARQFEESGQGVAWISGRYLYFQGGTPGDYTLSYDIEAGGRPSSAPVRLRVSAPPNDNDNANRVPEPPNLELRAIRNSSVRLQIPTTLVDPDGDSVELAELGVPAGAGHGNSVAVAQDDPNVVIFTAGDDRTAATDTFTYTVEDPHGGRGTATVKVVVLDPLDAPPQAHDDVFVAKPGRTLTIPVLANDVSPQDLALALDDEHPFVDLEGQPSTQPVNPSSVDLLDQTNPDQLGHVRVIVPAQAGPAGTLVEQYRIVDTHSARSDAYIRVSPDEDAPNMPPVATTDDNLTPADVADQAEVAINVLENDYDPDDDQIPVLSAVAHQPGRIDNGQLAVPVTDRIQRVLYRITDADGDSSVGIAIIPGDTNHPPELTEQGLDPSARTIDAASPQPLHIPLPDIVYDPDGDPDIRLTDFVINPAPGLGHIERDPDGTGFTFFPPDSLTETTSVQITFEVTDRADLTADQRATTPRCNCAKTHTIGLVIQASSAPEIVGPGSVSLSQLGETEYFDLAPLSYDREGDELIYTLNGSTGGLTVDQTGSRLTLVSNLSGDQLLPAGHTIPIAYTVSDGIFPPVENTLVVTIIETNRPLPVAGTFEAVNAERSTPTALPNLVDGAWNPFADQGPLTLDTYTASSGNLNCSTGGACTFVTDVVGQYQVTYTLRDPADRTVQGTVDIVVKGKPRAPGVPVIDAVGDHRVNLSWTAADMQGGEFVQYHVTAVETGTTLTTQSTSIEFGNLDNAVPYHFTVIAENELGMGEASLPSSAGTPDRVPDPPVALAFTDYGDQTLSLKWEPAATQGDFSAILKYEVEILGQTIVVPGGQTTLTVGLNGQGQPLTNGQPYTFRVRAQNSAPTNGGWGSFSSPGSGSGTGAASAIPSRFPEPPGQPTAVNSGDGGNPRLTVAWPAPTSDGGRALTEYRVCRVQDDQCQTVPASTRQAVFPSAGNQTFTFVVTAYNSDKNRNYSDPGPASAPVTAIKNPDPPSVSVTSSDHTVSATATGANNSGCSTQNFQFSLDGGAYQDSGTFTGLTNGNQYTVTARAVLPSTCGTPGQTYVSQPSAPQSTTPYGPLRQPTMNVSRSGNVITWTWSTNRGDDGRPDWTATLSGNSGCAGASVTSGSYAQDYGYSSGPRTCRITVSAGGQSLYAEGTESTPAPPPPPTATVTVPPPDRTCPEKDFTGPSNWNGGLCGGEGAGFIDVGTTMVVHCQRNVTYGPYNPWLAIQSGGPGPGWYVAAGTVTGNWGGLPQC